MRVVAFDIGIKNLSYCEVNGVAIQKWDIIDVSGNSFEQVSKNVFAFLANEFPLPDYDVILIENQPCNKNPTMKSIQMLVYSYFQIISLQAGSDNAVQVSLVSATTKLKVARNTVPKEKLTYAEKKKKSIELARLYLANSSIWLEKFNACKKKDDLSDAFLYCVKHLEGARLSNVCLVFD